MINNNFEVPIHMITPEHAEQKLKKQKVTVSIKASWSGFSELKNDIIPLSSQLNPPFSISLRVLAQE
jgi:hypothetical protein